MDSKSRIPTSRRRGNLIVGGPVAPNYKFMSASKASDARREYQILRKNYHDNIRRERLKGNKGSSFNELDYTGDLTPTLRQESNKEAEMRCVWCIRTHVRRLFSIGEE